MCISRIKYLPAHNRGKQVPKESTTIGGYLRKKRLKLNLRQSEVSRLLGFSTVTLSRWECNKVYSPNRASTLALLAYTDGLLYLANLVTHELRLINSPAYVQKLIEEELPKDEENLARLNGDDLTDPEVKAALRGEAPQHYGITLAVLTPDANYAITSCYGEAIRVWDTTSGECIANLPTPSIPTVLDGEVVCLEPMSDSKGVIAVTRSGCVLKWRFQEESLRFNLPKETKSIGSDVAVTPDGRWLLYDDFGGVKWWETAKVKLVADFSPDPYSYLRDFALSKDGSYAIFALADDRLKNNITVWDLKAGKPLAYYPLLNAAGSLSNVSNDGRFVCLTESGELHFLSLEYGPTGSSIKHGAKLKKSANKSASKLRFERAETD